MKLEEVKTFLDEFCYYKITSDADDEVLQHILDIKVKDVSIFYIESNKLEYFVLKNYFTNEACIIWDTNFWKCYKKFLGLIQQLLSLDANNQVIKMFYSNTADFLKQRVIDNKGLYEYFSSHAFGLVRCCPFFQPYLEHL